jgi:hypothetical protein
MRFLRDALIIFYRSFPVQLILLHFRKYQILLLCWFVLVSTILGGFMKTYGADALFLVPEYLGEVNALSALLVGMAMGVFFMSWNVTTFILHARRFTFLAATSKPFLKYCLNNALIPISFFGLYLVRAVQYEAEEALFSWMDQVWLIGGFVLGFILILLVSFAFFFGADKQILRTLPPLVPRLDGADPRITDRPEEQDPLALPVSWYLNTRFRWRQVRSASHYGNLFLDRVFKRHHVAGMIGILLAFLSLFTAGFFLEVPVFQVPAAASILVFFAILVAVIGALSYFLKSWSVLFVLAMITLLNYLYENEWIDPRNKAYGLNYANREERKPYSQDALAALSAPAHIEADRQHMLGILQAWKAKQKSEKPKLVFINVSGGGLRSAAFVMNGLQEIERVLGDSLMQRTILMSGASGGMLAATYYRELYYRSRREMSFSSTHPRYLDRVTRDLLNPIFSSMVSRDIFSPAQRFSVGPYSYVKDRGYAFERQFNSHTEDFLSKPLADYQVPEAKADMPMIFFNAVITRDGRKMMSSAQPIRFMMKPRAFAHELSYAADAVDFQQYFAGLNPGNVRLITLLRMNATFPYVLPNVWLPTEPVIDVMDAGLRDNYGQDISLRFIDYFADWIRENTSGVVIVQLRDRTNDGWQNPLETGKATDFLLKPASMLQHNWFKFQDYLQNDQYSFLKDDIGFPVQRVTFMYAPDDPSKGAALNFHLTERERQTMIAAFQSARNQEQLVRLRKLLRD